MQWNPVICGNMAVSGGHDAKRNKSATQKQIPHILTYMEKLKNQQK